MPRTDAGFTLLEVLVAALIAALVLGLLFEGSISGLKAARAAADYQEALSRARSHLAALLVQNFTAGTQDGDDGGGFHWQTQETPAGTATVPSGQGSGTPVLYALRVTISWEKDGGARSVSLHSDRLSSLPAAP
jgi:general secretion pathway protein I